MGHHSVGEGSRGPWSPTREPRPMVPHPGAAGLRRQAVGREKADGLDMKNLKVEKLEGGGEGHLKRKARH
jgi:hypothetical protein